MRTMIALLALLASPAKAQQQCAGLADVLATWGESVITSGATGDGVVVETWGNPDTGTWSIISLHSNGMACLLASGQAFSWQPPKPNA